MHTCRNITEFQFKIKSLHKQEHVVLQTEEHTPDAWIGLLKEPRQNGQPLGPTHKAMMVEQFGRILFGNRGMWWEKDLKRHVCVFKSEVQKTTLAKVIEDNTDVNPPAKVFKMAK